MNFKTIWLIALLTVLTGCTTAKPVVSNVDNTDASLTEAAYSVSRSIVNLAETAQAAQPLPPSAPPPNPSSYGMGNLMSTDWSGPVEPLLKNIAAATGYHLETLGTSPAIPVIITVNAKNTPVGTIMRDLAFQSSPRVAVVLYPANRVIELRYAKN